MAKHKLSIRDQIVLAKEQGDADQLAKIIKKIDSKTHRFMSAKTRRRIVKAVRAA